jgi:uncharacterized protein (DUF1800 family)
MTHIPTPRRAAALTACLLAGFALHPAPLAQETASPPAALEPAFVIPNDDGAIEHVLNRLGYGPRPGDVERVRAIGLGRYIAEQLHPERLADVAMKARLTAFTTLNMTSRELADEYFVPALMERRERQRAEAAREPAADSAGMRASSPDPDRPPQADAPARRPAAASEAIRKERLVLANLTEQKLVRAVYSQRQLEEVLVDFWFNHFNVFAGKGASRVYLTEYERDAIRPHALGRFRDLLGATAHSPAMLFYLDNWMSADPDAADAGPVRRQAGRAGLEFGRLGRRPIDGQARRPENPAPRRQRGLNENYARELMELHTLGVDGGYTQEDVVEVARAFTGWTIEDPRTGGGFRFAARLHDDGEKVVLGHRIPSGGGEKDGEQVLDVLARHPSTARFIATKLARRFVADEPPTLLVDRAAARFRETDGDIREVVRTIVTSPEFFRPEARLAKVKTPLEFVVSAVRASGADLTSARALGQSLRELGMPLYFAQPPTGYPETADAWVSAGALVNRMNFAIALAENRVRGTRVALSSDQAAALGLGAPEFQKR